MNAREVILGAMTEAEFQKHVTDYCDLIGLKWHHEVDSRKSKSGFPDLVIAGVGGVIFVELKTEKGPLKKEQKEWISRLEQAGAEVNVWRPSHLDEIHARLSELAGRRAVR